MHPLTAGIAHRPQLRTPVLVSATAVLIFCAPGASAQAPPAADQRKSFDTGFGACLGARGYSVK
jgi:hypothetical protein